MRRRMNQRRLDRAGQSIERARKKANHRTFCKMFCLHWRDEKNNNTTAALVAQDGHGYDTLGRFQDERTDDSLLFRLIPKHWIASTMTSIYSTKFVQIF